MTCDSCEQSGYKTMRVISNGVLLYIGACCGMVKKNWGGPGVDRPAFAFVDWRTAELIAAHRNKRQRAGKAAAFRKAREQGDSYEID